jgi:hypothetical protein
MEAEASWQLQEWGIVNIELLVILPIIPGVNCFSICRFREGFASPGYGTPGVHF